MADIRVGIAGLGAIGRALAKSLNEGVPGLALACAAAGDRAKAQAWLDAQGIKCPLVALEDFPKHADIAIECAPASALERICRPMLEAGKQVMVLSAGALLPRPDLIELAKTHGGTHSGADRRAARSRRRRRRGRRQHPVGADDHAQAAERIEGRAASREERRFRSTA